VRKSGFLNSTAETLTASVDSDKRRSAQTLACRQFFFQILAFHGIAHRAHQLARFELIFDEIVLCTRLHCLNGCRLIARVAQQHNGDAGQRNMNSGDALQARREPLGLSKLGLKAYLFQKYRWSRLAVCSVLLISGRKWQPIARPVEPELGLAPAAAATPRLHEHYCSA